MRDTKSQVGYVAKVADFGFCGIDASNDLSLRGHSPHWGAPEAEAPSSLPLNDRFKAKMLEDIYSFGLIALFLGLGGVDILAPSLFTASEVQRAKVNDWLQGAAIEALGIRYSRGSATPSEWTQSIFTRIIQRSLFADAKCGGLKLRSVRSLL